MPPKPKCTKEQIVGAALTLIKEGGENALNARAVAAKLGMTVSPIFTVFSGMDELKQAAFEAAKKECFADLAGALRYTPAFKEFGLRFVRYAIHRTHLFRFVFAGNITPVGMHGEFLGAFTPMLAEISKTFGISEADAEGLLNQMFIYSCGIAFMQVGDEDAVSDEVIGQRLSEACISHVMFIKLRTGTFDERMLGTMAAAVSQMPVPKDAE